MINLLPGEYRTHLRYGRLNARLGRWLFVGILLIAGLVLILSVSWLYMNQQISNLDSSTAETKSQLKAQKLEQVQKQADEISQNIKTIDKVLNQEIRFSELIQEIGKVMPKGAVLNSLTISTVNGALNLSANTKGYPQAAQIAVNLSDPKNDIFKDVDIVDIKCTPGSAYPCAANFTALFGKNTPSRFLNVATESSP